MAPAATMDSVSSLGPSVQALSESGVDVPEKFIRNLEERVTITPFDDFGENIPVIDLGKLDDASSREEILQEIADACENWGFFQESFILPPKPYPYLIINLELRKIRAPTDCIWFGFGERRYIYYSGGLNIAAASSRAA